MFKNIAAAAALVVASSTAFAAQPGTFYAGGDVGKTKLENQSGRATSAGAFIGYNFHQNFAVEAGYRRLGDYDFHAFGVHGDVNVDQAALSLVGTLPLSSGFNLFGRVGYNRLEVEGSANGYHAKDSVSKALIGVGVGYAFTPTISARIELQRPASDTHNVSAGVAFQF
ncbi:outer membrane beta-barrel protein [Massilia consociata]|uniref:Outer membrane beta-barrel protein n=1 Tax=Massilia consociata TaxID=760117 RepID=A0ABV6FFM0_9BURK